MKEFYLLLIGTVLLCTNCFGQNFITPDDNFLIPQGGLSPESAALPIYFDPHTSIVLNQLVSPEKHPSQIHLRDNTTLKLDSILNNTQKRAFQYDEYGNVLYALAQRRINIFGNWVDTFANAFIYDVNGNTIEHINYLFSAPMNQLQNNFKRTYEYDINDLEILFTSYNWDIDTETWINSVKTENFYVDNNIAERISYSWNSDSAVWSQNTKLLFTYNEDGKNTLTEYFLYNSTQNEWVNFFKYMYDFNSENLWIQTTIQVWNTINDTWANHSRILAEYNAAGSAISFTRENWNANQSNWVGSNINEYVYNSSNFLVDHTASSWNVNQNDWVPFFRTGYLVDNFGNRLESLRYIWIQQTNSWEKNSKFVRNINLDYLVADLVTPNQLIQYQPFNLGGVHKISGENLYAYEPNLAMWFFHEAYNYFYSEIQLTSVNETEISEILVYPNPFTNEVYISLGASDLSFSFKLYDITGKTVFSGYVHSGGKTDLSFLAPGVYLYSILIDNQRKEGRIVKF